jgi:hypothetical protein
LNLNSKPILRFFSFLQVHPKLLSREPAFFTFDTMFLSWSQSYDRCIHNYYNKRCRCL